MSDNLNEVHERCDMACDIIKRTNDGEDLAPRHLKLVEMAVNGFLNEKGMTAFKELHASVLKGYVKPWFCGIEHLTIDHRGYVYWKGHQVEHYNYGPDQMEQRRAAAEEVARRCRIVEARGETPSVKNVVWHWKEGA